VGVACDTHGRGDKRVLGHSGKTQRKETAWKTAAYIGDWDQNRSYGRLEEGKWIQLAQDRDRWWAPVNAVIKLWVLAP
jgi:hypothetical protein